MNIHLFLPGTHKAMAGQHDCTHPTCLGTLPVTGSECAARGELPIQAILTKLSVAEQIGIETKQPIVVQSLDDCSAFGFCGIVHSRRNERENIIAVNYLNLMLSDYGSHPVVGVTVPKCPCGQIEASHLGNCSVMSRVDKYLMAVLPQQVDFSRKGPIFASGLLIKVVNSEYPHLAVFLTLRAPLLGPQGDDSYGLLRATASKSN